jgi:hypothetical protein
MAGIKALSDLGTEVSELSNDVAMRPRQNPKNKKSPARLPGFLQRAVG